MRKLITALIAAIAIATGLATAIPAGASSVSHRPAVFGTVHRTFAATVTFGPNEYANTAIQLRPDSGNTDFWAYDNFSRRAHVALVGVTSPTNCGFAPSSTHACFQWNWTLFDNGTPTANPTGDFQTIIGQHSPGATSLVQPLYVVERGTFGGHVSGVVFDSYKNAFPADVPTSENDNGNLPLGDSTTGRWPCQFFGGAGFCHPGITTFGYNYSVPAGSDARCPAGTWHWADTSANGDGGLPVDGNIYAPDSAHCATTTNT